MHKKTIHGGGINHWACINLSQYVTVAVAPQLCNELIEICLTSGVVFERNPVLTIQCVELAAMGVSSYTSNVVRGGQQADPGYLGFGSCGRTEVVQRPREINFHKQEEDRPFPRKETVMMNQNEYEEISKVADLTYEYQERSRLSTISEDIHPATSKSKKIVLGPEAALEESQNNTATMKGDKRMKECELLDMAEYAFATLNHRMDTDETTEIPLGRLEVLLWEAMHALTLTLLAISKEDSGRQMTGACRTNQPMNPRVGQTDDSGPWTKGGCWIYFVQDANGHMWERSCRDLRIHHVQPD